MQRIERHDRAALRQFALVLAGFVGVVFGLAGPWLLGRPWPAWPWWTAGALAAVGIALPAAIYPLYRLLAPPLRLLATVNNWVLLGIVYFLVVWPYGALARLARRLHYVTGFDPGAASYRVPRETGGRRDGPTDLDQPF